MGGGRRAPSIMVWRLGLALACSAAPAFAVPLPVPRPKAILEAPAPADVPLPVPRPAEDGPTLPPARAPALPGASGPLSIPPPPAPPEPDLACGRLLAGDEVVARAAAPVAGPDGCGIAAPVTLEAVVLRDGRRVPLVPHALMRCDLAERLADWIRDDVAPSTGAEGDLTAIADAAAYVCRTRNGVAGARLSEHARGNAIDLLAFRFARRVVGLKEADARETLTAIRASACARFSTVLGPGSDAFHDLDLHLDLARRRNGARLCQWTVP